MAKLRQLLENCRQEHTEPATSFINDMEFHICDAYPELANDKAGAEKVVWKIQERMLPELQSALAASEHTFTIRCPV